MRTSLLFKIIISCLFTLIVAGCAKSPNPVDPYEKVNRFTYKFNTGVDKLLLRPIAYTYSKVTPPPLKRGLSNAASNIGEINNMANDLLQLKLRYFFVNFWRFFINSTVGVGGLFDVASSVGLPKHPNDFGLTLAYWSGGKPSPYFVMPFFGPGTFRSAFAYPFDAYVFEPFVYIKPDSLKYYYVGAKVITVRARLLGVDRMIATAFDPYVFVRNGYLQRRNRAIAKNQKEH